MDLSELVVEHFEPRIGQVFTVRLDAGQAVETRLISATRLGPASSPPQGRRAFSLVFLGPMSPVLRQSIYTVEHTELGALDIFIVPVGPDGEQRGMRYEAVFT